jgi:hypothetical protein
LPVIDSQAGRYAVKIYRHFIATLKVTNKKTASKGGLTA